MKQLIKFLMVGKQFDKETQTYGNIDIYINGELLWTFDNDLTRRQATKEIKDLMSDNNYFNETMINIFNENKFEYIGHYEYEIKFERIK